MIGQGIAGMSAAWLLSQRHRVTVYEAEPRFGGHSHTVEAPGANGPVPVDMGFIVYNEANYPNFAALLAHLGAPSAFTDMSFGVSLDDGDLEYASTDLGTLFAQPRNLLRPRFWSMLKDLVRFSRQAPAHACGLDARMTSLGDYLGEAGYGRPFQDDHLLPQAAAIWSASVEAVRELPAAAFIRFFENHGLLNILDKPLWRTVVGGSREYVRRLAAPLADARLGVAATRVVRSPAGMLVTGADGRVERDRRGSSPATPTRASGCWPSPPRPSGRSSAPSATPRTWRCCIRTPASCPSAAGPGRAGTISARPAPMAAAGRSVSPTG